MMRTKTLTPISQMIVESNLDDFNLSLSSTDDDLSFDLELEASVGSPPPDAPTTVDPNPKTSLVPNSPPTPEPTPVPLSSPDTLPKSTVREMFEERRFYHRKAMQLFTDNEKMLMIYLDYVDDMLMCKAFGDDEEHVDAIGSILAMMQVLYSFGYCKNNISFIRDVSAQNTYNRWQVKHFDTNNYHESFICDSTTLQTLDPTRMTIFGVHRMALYKDQFAFAMQPG
jgi:hypothetical protein